MTASEPNQPIVASVVAVARNGVIGRDGDLPWRLSSDLKMFRKLTMDKPLIMGRRTFQSLKKPLDGRDNIVVTRDDNFAAVDGVLIACSVAEALDIAKTCAARRGAEEIMVIGGAAIYQAMAEDVSRIYWTAVNGEPEGDTFYPKLDPKSWVEVSRTPIPQGPKDEFAAELRVYERSQSLAPNLS